MNLECLALVIVIVCYLNLVCLALVIVTFSFIHLFSCHLLASVVTLMIIFLIKFLLCVLIGDQDGNVVVRRQIRIGFGDCLFVFFSTSIIDS